MSAGRRRVLAMVKRNLLVQMRNPGHWFLLIVLPLVDGLLFGSIGVAFGEGEAPVQLLVTGIMLFHLIWQLTLAGSLGLLEEVWSRNVMNLIATPLTEREFMGSLGIVGLLLFDYFFHVRSAHVPTLREAAVWSCVYVGIALLFGTSDQREGTKAFVEKRPAAFTGA